MLRRFVFRVVLRFELLCLLLCRYLLLLGLPTMGSHGLLLALADGWFLFRWLLATTAAAAIASLGSYCLLFALLSCCLLFGWFLVVAAVAAANAATAAPVAATAGGTRTATCTTTAADAIAVAFATFGPAPWLVVFVFLVLCLPNCFCFSVFSLSCPACCFFAAFFSARRAAFFSAFARISCCSATSPFNLWRFSCTRFFSFALFWVDNCFCQVVNPIWTIAFSSSGTSHLASGQHVVHIPDAWQRRSTPTKASKKISSTKMSHNKGHSTLGKRETMNSTVGGCLAMGGPSGGVLSTRPRRVSVQLDSKHTMRGCHQCQ